MPEEQRHREKPPDYEQVTSLPPSYDEALKLNPSALLARANVFQTSAPVINSTTLPIATGGVTNNAFTLTSETSSRPSSSSYASNVSINKLKQDKTATTKEDEKSEPPPYSITPSWFTRTSIISSFDAHVELALFYGNSSSYNKYNLYLARNPSMMTT